MMFMAALGEVLERLATSTTNSDSVHAIVSEWRHEVEVEAGTKRSMHDVSWPIRLFSALMAVPISAYFRLRPSRVWTAQRQTGGVQMEVWLRASGQMRVECSWSEPSGPQHELTIAAAGTRSSSHPAVNRVECLFWPEQLREILATVELTPGALATIAGRPALDVAARVPADSSNGPWPHWLPAGADEWILTFDREHGHLLKTAGRYGDDVLTFTEVSSITYGDHLDDALFRPS